MSTPKRATTISRIEAIRKIIDQEVGLESCQPGIAEIEKRYDDLYHDYIDGKLKHRELYNLAQTLDIDTDKFFGKVRHAWILANESTFVALRKRAQNLTSFDESTNIGLETVCCTGLLYAVVGLLAVVPFLVCADNGNVNIIAQAMINKLLIFIIFQFFIYYIRY